MKRSVAVLVATILIGGAATVSAQAIKLPGWAGLLRVGTQVRQYASQLRSMLSGFQEAFGLQIDQTQANIRSYVKIATAQDAASSKNVVDSIVRSGQALADAMQNQEIADDVADATADVHWLTGHGYDPCGTAYRVESMDMGFDMARERARRTVADADAAPGKLVDSSVKVMEERLRKHREKFCSASEAAAGQCTQSEVPGGDVNAALLFEPADENSLKAEARKAYIDHVLGEPDQKTEKEAGSSSAGEQYFLDKSRKDSLMSTAALSFAKIDADNTRTQELNGKSPNELMKDMVNQYFGGERGRDWAQRMTMQRMRGLLAEANRMAALENWMRYRNYERALRMEASLASLSLAATNDNSGHTGVASERPSVNRRASEIK